MYLLDANVFIDAKNRYYGMDFAPGFWDWLLHAHGLGTVFTVRAVANEIAAGNDELHTWFKNLPASFVHTQTAADAPHMSTLARWASQSTHYRREAIAEFLSSADYQLVAQAKTLGYTVVTHETANPDGKRRVKIPEACDHLGVAYTSPFQLLRSQSVQLKI